MRLAVVDGLDVIPVWIKQERRIISRMIRPLTWFPVIRTTICKACLVNCVNHFAVC